MFLEPKKGKVIEAKAHRRLLALFTYLVGRFPFICLTVIG